MRFPQGGRSLGGPSGKFKAPRMRIDFLWAFGHCFWFLLWDKFFSWAFGPFIFCILYGELYKMCPRAVWTINIAKKSPPSHSLLILTVSSVSILLGFCSLLSLHSLLSLLCLFSLLGLHIRYSFHSFHSLHGFTVRYFHLLLSTANDFYQLLPTLILT